ncbi:HAD hydrolase, IA, variant 1 family protein, partial [Vibrio parahaemolyticus V-223/04]
QNPTLYRYKCSPRSGV